MDRERKRDNQLTGKDIIFMLFVLRYASQLSITDLLIHYPFIPFTYSHPGLAHRIRAIGVHDIAGTRMFGWVRGSHCKQRGTRSLEIVTSPFNGSAVGGVEEVSRIADKIRLSGKVDNVVGEETE